MEGFFALLIFFVAPIVVRSVPFSATVNDTSSGFKSLAFNGTSVSSNITSSSTTTSSSASGSSTYAPVSQPALLPDVHWDEPISDIENLAPTSGQSLYYSNNGAASMSFNMLLRESY